MTSLFEDTFNEPLPSRLRPNSLDEFVGQKHLVGEGNTEKTHRNRFYFFYDLLGTTRSR